MNLAYVVNRCLCLLSKLGFTFTALMIIKFMRRYFVGRINYYKLFHVLVNVQDDYKLTLISWITFLCDNVILPLISSSLMNIS
jgi:hypothetical protein